MDSPDELYTLRAQFWLGHYSMALEEAKQIQRRPMSPALKAEREELVARCYLALGQFDKVTSTETPALTALSLHAQFRQSGGGAGADASNSSMILSQLQSMLGDGVDSHTQLYCAHVFLQAGMKKEALQAVSLTSSGVSLSLEQVALQALIYLQLDRLDLAQKIVRDQLLKMDEDSILTQLTNVQVKLAVGSSAAQEALHGLQQLSEQYGQSVFLLNLQACACLQAGQYAQAEQSLEQARQEFGADDADTLCNLVVAYQYQQKPTDALVSQLKIQYPNHFLSKGLEMVEGAFDRESVKYQVAA